MKIRNASPHPNDVMKSLVAARPARLDAEAGQWAGWQDVGDFLNGAEFSVGAGGEPRTSGRRRAVAARAVTRGRNLLAALASAVATAAAIAIAVAIGTAAPVTSHHAPRGPRTGQARGTNKIVFHRLRLNGGWRGSVEYAVSDGVVYLAGSARESSRRLTSVTTLPGGVRPTSQLDIVVVVGHGAGEIQVTPDGQITAFSPGHQVTSVSLDGVSFPLASGRS